MKNDEARILRSEVNAWKMLDIYTQRIGHRFGHEVIEAVILVGSLTTGSYIAGPGSDIDQITIIRDGCHDSITNSVINLLREVEEQMAFGIPFSRMVFFRRELARPLPSGFKLTKENKKYIEIPVELLRIHESGKTIWGNKNIISELPIPTREEVVAFDELGRRWSRIIKTTDSKGNVGLRELPARISAQVILTNAFRHYYYATGESCSNKLRIARCMSEKVEKYRFQKALELSTLLKRNLGQGNVILSDEQVNFIVAEAEKLVEWKETHAIDGVPMRIERDSK